MNFKGTAGQSFGCWNSKGVDLFLKGCANDYVGKGMNGGKIVISKNNSLKEKRSVLAGNTCLFGSTGGEFYANGTVGERFAVRNSGAKAVIEGAGDHCCEYMTGGEVIVLGPVTSQDMEAHRSYLKDRIYRFLNETKSEVAEEILNDFDKYQSLFWIVTPDAENLSRIIKNTREEAA